MPELSNSPKSLPLWKCAKSRAATAPPAEWPVNTISLAGSLHLLTASRMLFFMLRATFKNPLCALAFGKWGRNYAYLQLSFTWICHVTVLTSSASIALPLAFVIQSIGDNLSVPRNATIMTWLLSSSLTKAALTLPSRDAEMSLISLYCSTGRVTFGNCGLRSRLYATSEQSAARVMSSIVRSSLCNGQ